MAGCLLASLHMDDIEEIKANYSGKDFTARVGTIIFKNKAGYIIKIKSVARRVEIKYRIEDLILMMLSRLGVEGYEYGQIRIWTNIYT